MKKKMISMKELESELRNAKDIHVKDKKGSIYLLNFDEDYQIFLVLKEIARGGADIIDKSPNLKWLIKEYGIISIVKRRK